MRRRGAGAGLRAPGEPARRGRLRPSRAQNTGVRRGGLAPASTRSALNHRRQTRIAAGGLCVGQQDDVAAAIGGACTTPGNTACESKSILWRRTSGVPRRRMPIRLLLGVTVHCRCQNAAWALGDEAGVIRAGQGAHIEFVQFNPGLRQPGPSRRRARRFAPAASRSPASARGPCTPPKPPNADRWARAQRHGRASMPPSTAR